MPQARRAAAAAAVRVWIGSMLGVDELLLAVALTLVTVGSWPLLGRGALVVPGIVLLWIVLPTRGTFIVRPTATEKKSDRSAS